MSTIDVTSLVQVTPTTHEELAMSISYVLYFEFANYTSLTMIYK